jgi:hypothetical protein
MQLNQTPGETRGSTRDARLSKQVPLVSADWAPQMAQSAQVLRDAPPTAAVRYAALAPNVRGGHDAVKAGADELTIFVSALVERVKRRFDVRPQPLAGDSA